MNCRRMAVAVPIPLLLATIITSNVSMGAEITCRFQSPTDRVHISVLSNRTTIWNGTIDKGSTKSVDIPEGPFLVISKVYNPNLKTTGDIRAEAHTHMCQEQGVLSVPLFADAR